MIKHVKKKGTVSEAVMSLNANTCIKLFIINTAFHIDQFRNKNFYFTLIFSVIKEYQLYHDQKKVMLSLEGATAFIVSTLFIPVCSYMKYVA